MKKLMMILMLTIMMAIVFSFSTVRTENTSSVENQFGASNNLYFQMVDMDVMIQPVLGCRHWALRCDNPAGQNGNECPYFEPYQCCTRTDPYNRYMSCPLCGMWNITHVNMRRCLDNEYCPY